MMYIDLIRYLQIVIASHFNVKDVIIGYDSLNEIAKDQIFPLVYIQLLPVLRSVHSITYQFEIYYIDRLTHEKTNFINILNASSNTLNDILTKIHLNQDIEIIYDVTLTPFIDSYDGEIAGHFITLQLTDLNYDVNDCINNFSI